MTILITGATGNIGRLLVAELLARDLPVRALTRDPESATASLPDGVSVVAGDLADAADSVFEGVDRVFVFPADSGAEDFVERAVTAGVSRFVVLSSLAVSGRHARDAGSASEVHHGAVELAVTSRADDWTILRPGNFANNLLAWAFPIRSGFPVRIPYPASSQVLTHEKDVAAAAAIALTEPGHSGRIYELTGPQSLSKVEQLAAISDAIGREIPWVEITPEEFRDDMAQYIPGDVIDMLLRYWSETVDAPEVPLEPALGIRPTSLAEWAQDHRAAFAG